MQKTLTLLICLLLAGTAFAGEKKGDRQQQEYFPEKIYKAWDAAWDGERNKIYFTNGGTNPGAPVLWGTEDEAARGRLTCIELCLEDYPHKNTYFMPNIELEAGKGLVKKGDSLYIVDPGDDLVYEYDLISETVTDTFPLVHPEKYLYPHDIVYDSEGTLYVSDNRNNFIFEKNMSSASFTVMELSGEELIDPVGMYYDEPNNRIIIVEYADSNAAIKALDLNSDSVYTIKQTNLKHLISITRDRYGDWYFTAGGQTGSATYDWLFGLNSDFSGEMKKLAEYLFQAGEAVCIPGRDSILLIEHDLITMEELIKGTPNMVYPANSATGIESNIVFRWDELTHAHGYRMQVSKNADFTDCLYSYRWKYNEPFIELDDFELGETYYWRVKGITGTQSFEGDWTESSSFTTSATEVSGPNLIYPPADTNDMPEEIVFQWDSVPGAGSYEIWIATDDDYGHLEYVKETSQTSKTFSYLGKSNDYYWKVRSLGGSHGSMWSESSTFSTVEAELDRPIPIAPYPNTSMWPLNLEIVWDTVPGATKYHIQIEEETEYDNHYRIWGNWITDSTTVNYYSFSELLPLGKFIWRVKALNDSASSRWSWVCPFTTTDTVITPPGIISPGTDNVGLTPTFVWTDNLANYYSVQIAELKNPNDYIINFINSDLNKDLVMDTTLTLESELKADTRYIWRVRSNISSRAISCWSETGMFNTGQGSAVKEIVNTDDYLRIIPNPVSDNAQILLSNLTAGAIKIDLYNCMGDRVKTIYSGPVEEQLAWDTKELSSGIYYINVISGAQSFTKKVIISR